MSTIDVVIGANFGDEGKGLMTDYLAHKYEGNCVVIRFNGGAQAGHTVHTPDGERHIFSHFGSGSFTGAKTHLSKYFICSPVLFAIELEKIHKFNKSDMVNNTTVDPRCMVSTPFDMIINQGIERKRANNRHGSCGSGVHETIVRHKIISLTVSDIIQNNYTLKLFEIIKYCTMKAQMLELDDEVITLLNSPNVLLKFLEDIILFSNTISCKNDETICDEHIIFEGAQGLLLDEGHEYFPHVTHSKTGMHNVSEFLNQYDYLLDEDINVYYMSRGYMTRHGAGPFTSESNEIPYDIVDETNIHNEWQQSLRLGYLDINILIDTINNDFLYISNNDSIPNTQVKLNLVLTCMDHIPNDLTIVNGGLYVDITKTQLYEMMSKSFNKVFISEGPTRNTIKSVY